MKVTTFFCLPCFSIVPTTVAPSTTGVPTTVLSPPTRTTSLKVTSCVCAHDAPPIKIFNVSEVSLCEDSPSTAGTNPLGNSSRAVAQDVHLVNVTILSFFPSNDKRKSYFDYSYSAH